MASFGGNLCYFAVTTHLAKHTFVCGYQTFFFCLIKGGGSSKSGKSLKGVSKKSIFASPESIQGKVS